MPPSTIKAAKETLSHDNAQEPSSRRGKSAQILSPLMQTADAKENALVVVEADKNADALLAPVFRSDLNSIRNLVTCSICDQLLYEPFTIQCGHTYCYSCLCSWFLPNKKNKTCPECRAVVKQIPAPSFMIKQMVELFTKRVELMPADESVDQHVTKRMEEVAAVERDRASTTGLFKGLFSGLGLLHDEADGVQRCPACMTEYVGGPACLTCGVEIDADGFNFSGDDIDSDDLEDELETELDSETAEHRAFRRNHPFFNGASRLFVHPHGFPFDRHGNLMNEEGTASESDESRDNDGHRGTESEDEGSLQDFIDDDSPESRRNATPQDHGFRSRVRVDISPHRRRLQINVSDTDDTDEEDPVVIPAGRRNRYSRHTNQSRVPVINLTDDEENGSEEGSPISTSERLRHAGWSPLHENENEETYARDTSDASDQSNDASALTEDDESDTETMVGNDDDRGHRSLPRVSGRQATDVWDVDTDYGSDASGIMDQDGDTEMSVSPVSRAVYRGDYGELSEDESSQASRLDTEEYEGGFDNRADVFDTEADLGNGYNVQDYGDESDDTPPQPVRRRARAQQSGREHDYNPRFSHFFAEHQSMRENSLGSDRYTTDLEELEPAVEGSSESGNSPRYTDAHVNRHAPSIGRARVPYQYRMSGARNARSRGRTQSPATVRIISSSNRPSRVERRYHNDHAGPRASTHWS